jgi:hypothetical protein
MQQTLSNYRQRSSLLKAALFCTKDVLLDEALSCLELTPIVFASTTPQNGSINQTDSLILLLDHAIAKYKTNFCVLRSIQHGTYSQAILIM